MALDETARTMDGQIEPGASQQSLHYIASMQFREDVMETGLVKWFNNAKGWGFIAGRDGSDVFVHYSQISGDGYRTLREGQQVAYDLRLGPRGQFAENVKIDEKRDGT